MEKARKLEITRVLKKCSELFLPSDLAVLILRIEISATDEELKEFFSITREEKLALFDEVVKQEEQFSMLELKLGAILKRCYNDGSGPEICLSLMLSMTEASMDDCIAFMSLGGKKHSEIFCKIEDIKAKSRQRAEANK